MEIDLLFYFMRVWMCICSDWGDMAWGQAFAFFPRVICEAISLLTDLKEAC